jgi:hypothetical protein
LLLFGGESGLYGYGVEREGVVRLERGGVFADGSDEDVGGGDDDGLGAEVPGETDHEGDPGVGIGIGVGAEVAFAVGGFEAFVLGVAVDSDGADASAEEIPHEIEAGLKDAGYDYRGPVFFSMKRSHESWFSLPGEVANASSVGASIPWRF